jgi:hypothetical protein
MTPGLRRGVFYSLLLEAVVGVLIAAACTGTAHAAPAQVEADRIAGWMAHQLHADVPTRTLVAARHHQLDQQCAVTATWIAYVCERDMSVLRIRPWLVGALERRSCDGLRVMLHEFAHSDRGFPAIRVEEGIADALSLDLYPAAARQLGCRGRGSYIPIPFYPGDARMVWTTATVATGSRDRWARAARLWVRRLWAADPDGRRIMLTQAMTMKEAQP